MDKDEEFKIGMADYEVIMQNNSVKITDEKIVLAPISYAIIKMN